MEPLRLAFLPPVLRAILREAVPLRVPSILNVAKPWILGKKDFVNPDFGNEDFGKMIWLRGFIKMDFALPEPLKGLRNLPSFFIVPGRALLYISGRNR